GSVPATVALPGSGAKVSLGLRPQHLELDTTGKTHRVEMTEALGGVSYIHLTAPTGEKLVVESHSNPDVKMGGMTGIRFDPKDALFFSDTGLRLR
ncbi:MAG: TOBE domain-containing protein, partial [Rhodobacter sp.]|nr:TOBE domain-containing protein [Rhodobacter sp.]